MVCDNTKTSKLTKRSISDTLHHTRPWSTRISASRSERASSSVSFKCRSILRGMLHCRRCRSPSMVLGGLYQYSSHSLRVGGGGKWYSGDSDVSRPERGTVYLRSGEDELRRNTRSSIDTRRLCPHSYHFRGDPVRYLFSCTGSIRADTYSTSPTAYNVFSAYSITSAHIVNGQCVTTSGSAITLNPAYSETLPSASGRVSLDAAGQQAFINQLGFSTCSGGGENAAASALIPVANVTSTTTMTISSVPLAAATMSLAPVSPVLFSILSIGSH